MDRNWIEREGTFRGEIIETGVKQFDGKQSVAATMLVRILEQWNFDDGEWLDWSQYGEYVAQGDVWVVGKDGKPLESNVGRLKATIGWTGTFATLQANGYVGQRLQFTVEGEEYKDQDWFKIGFVDPWGRTPGGMAGTLDTSAVEGLDARYGGAMRAIGGPPPAGKPAAPPNAPRPTPPVDAPESEAEPVDAGQGPGGGGVPF